MTPFRPAALAAALLAAALGGCGGEAKKLPTVPAGGKLTYKDPKRGPVPAAGALVVFNPVNQDSKNLYFPQAKVRDDGTFELTTHTDGDGAPAGEYGVTILWKAPTKTIGGEDRNQGADLLGGRFADPQNPRIKQTVTAAGPNRFDITIE